jgi:putative hemolysin
MLRNNTLDAYFAAESRRHFAKNKLRLGFANTLEDVREVQRLRWQVFVEEMGARLSGSEPGLESDRFDRYCQHLMVRDATTGNVVGCYRILTDTQAAHAGGFYSQTEFDLTRVLALPGRTIEVGRTCVHPDYRQGAVISLLWSGLARFMMLHRYDRLMGCASAPLGRGIGPIGALWHEMAARHLAPPEWRVSPKIPLSALPCPDPDATLEVPPLLKGYLRLGALVCGEPAWDPVFNVADFFLLLILDRVTARYAQHYIRRSA